MRTFLSSFSELLQNDKSVVHQCKIDLDSHDFNFKKVDIY